MYQIERIRMLLGRKKGAYGQVLSADERQYEDRVEEKSGRTNEISLVIYQGWSSVVSVLQTLFSWDRAAWLNTEELQGWDELTVKLSHKHARTHECLYWLLCIFYSAEKINRHSRIMMGWHLLCHCVLNVEYCKACSRVLVVQQFSEIFRVPGWGSEGIIIKVFFLLRWQMGDSSGIVTIAIVYRPRNIKSLQN